MREEKCLPRGGRFFLLVAFVCFAGAAQAAAPDPWDAPEVREVLASWSSAKARQLMGEMEDAVRLYQSADERAGKAVGAVQNAGSKAILIALQNRAKAALAGLKAGEIANRLRQPREVLADMAVQKARADRFRDARKLDEARAEYEALMRAAELFQEKFRDDGESKAAVWLGTRCKDSISELARGAADPMAADRTFAASVRDYVVKSSVRDSLSVFTVPIEEPGAAKTGKPAPAGSSPAPAESWAAAVAGIETVGAPSGSGAVRDRLTTVQPDAAPVEVGKPAAPKLPQLGNVDMDVKTATVSAAVAKAYLDGASTDLSIETARSALDALIEAEAKPEAILSLADLLAKKADIPTAAGAVMGAPDKEPDRARTAALRIYLHVLERFPDHVAAPATTKKAFQLCLDLGGIDEHAGALKQGLTKERPGLLGVLLFKLYRSAKRDGDACGLMEEMLADAGRFLPKSTPTEEALKDGFNLLLASSKLDAAHKAVGLLASRKPADAGALWLLLAEGYFRADRPGEAQPILKKLVSDYPGRPEAARAAAILSQKEKPLLEPAADRTLTERELAELATAAHARPNLYRRLAQEYEKAGQYAKAREAYLVYARRFDSADAAYESVLTYFKEGKTEEGIKEAEAYVQRYPATKGAQELAGRIRERYLAAKDAPRWAEFCIRAAEKLAGEPAKPYLNEAADVLCRGLLTGNGGESETQRKLKVAVEASRHRQEIERLVKEKTELLRKQMQTVSPDSTAPKPASLIERLGADSTLKQGLKGFNTDCDPADMGAVRRKSRPADMDQVEPMKVPD